MQEANNWLTKSMQPTTPFLAIMKLRGYRQMAGQFRPTSAWLPMTSHDHQTGLSLPQWPAFNCTSSLPSTPICPGLMGLCESATISRQRIGLKLATNTLLNCRNKNCRTRPSEASGLFFNPSVRIQQFQQFNCSGIRQITHC